MENLYLIVGLGNPGAEYARTRHNAGFMLVERLASRWQAKWELSDKFVSRLARVERDGRRLMLCQPQTFMNQSGEAVGKLRDYFQAPLDRVLVAVDDADLPLGEIRMRPQGASGGHHGLESIEERLSTRQYARLRVGIGRAQSDGRAITNYVLGRFSAEDAALVDKVLDRAADQVECWLSQGIGKAMSQFNGALPGFEHENKQ
jgi:peptidyl-tRNA hydrolase, PTH1 family